MGTVEFASLSLYDDAALQEYYRLEDLTGKNGNTLTNNNVATFVAAKFNNGVSGGSSDANKSLSIASALGYDGGAYSVSFWLKINTAPGSGELYNIFELVDAVSDTTFLLEYVNTAGVLSLNFMRLRLAVAGDAQAYNIDLGTTDFHHIVFAYDGSTLKGYIDGVERVSISSTGNGSGGTAKFSILEGRNANNGSTLGIVDDFALIKRNLTQAEVDLIYSGLPNNDKMFAMFR